MVQFLSPSAQMGQHAIAEDQTHCLPQWGLWVTARIKDTDIHVQQIPYRGFM